MAAKSWYLDAIVFLVALSILAAAMIFLHALNSGLSGSDEGSHFLNGYLIWAYVTEAFGQNPLTYATDFYIHYPKLSIGHWPPLYYVFLSGFFFVVPHAPLPFMLVNLVVGALPVLLISRVVRRVADWPWVVLAGITYVLIPISLNNTSRLMLDQALAGLCLLAALVWSDYAKRPTLWRGMAYAAVTAAAILVKGNGWVLAIFPIFHIALTGRPQVLLNWRTYAAGAAAILVVGAWTVVTYKISSDGFNYSWGLDYFLLALPTFLSAIYSNLGLVGSIAALIGIAVSFAPGVGPELREVGRTGLAMVLATILFHSFVPVDLDPRYMSSAIPYLVIFMTIGVWTITQRLSSMTAHWWLVTPLAVALFAIPGVLYLRDRSARFDLRMDLVAAEITTNPTGLVVVVDGHSGTEGSLAAEVALRDTTRKNYVVRSSQLLAKSDFMGNKYALRVNTPAAVLGLLDDVTCSAVAVAEGPGIVPRFPHSDLLLSALRDPASPFRLARTYEHKGQNGRTFLYLRSIPMPPQRDAVKRVSFPEKAPRQ